MPSKAFLVLCVSSAAAVSCGCGGGPIVRPTPIPNPPTVSCPADIALESRQGQPQPSANFDTPAARDGQLPVTVSCAPGSGSLFPNGTTTVTCEATDALTRKSSCTFLVTVTAVIVPVVPRLEKTKFLAFGDSLTEGKTSLRAPTTIFTVPGGIFNVPGSYPELLHAKLSARYTDQTITMIADGLGNEDAGEGKLRLTDDLNRFSPEVLLLFEGVNEMLHTNFASQMPAAIDSAVIALRNMVQQAKGRGVRVFVATLTPMDPDKNRSLQAPFVPTMNDRIKAMAAAENVPVVDLYAVVPLSMIGNDGLHPRSSAYPVIADEWLKAIRATLETKTTGAP